MTSYSDAPRLPEGRGLDLGAWLGGDGPLELEIGPGRGGFLLDRLELHPTIRMIGFEIRRKWAFLLDERLRERGFGQRARVFAEDAREAVPRLRTGSVVRVFVHFPDPWWKKRHQKRRVLNPELIGELARVVEPGGELFIQTDVPERGALYEKLLGAEHRFLPFEGHARVAENPYGALSPRERRAAYDGLPIVRLRYRRVGVTDS